MSSRESDSAYPPPRQGGTPGRRPGEGGQDAYPSGTPPYGTPNGFGPGHGVQPGGARQGAAQQGAPEDDDVPKTETTLTTRVRINIPGSRPIPPVVVRSAMKSEDAPAAPAEPAGPRHRSGASPSPVLGLVESGERTATPPNLPPEWQQAESGAASGSSSESTGEWFRPRQKGRQDAGPAPVPTAAAPRTAAAAPSAAMQSSPSARPPQPPAADESRPNPAPAPSGAPASPFGGGNAGRRQNEGRDTGTGRAPAFGGAPRAGDPYREGPQDPFAADPFATGRAASDPFATTGQAPQRAAQDPFATGPNGRTAGADPFAAGRTRQSGPPQAAGEPEDTQIGGFEPVQDDFPPTAAIPGAPSANLFGSVPPAPADPFAANGRPGPQDPFAPGRGAAPADPFGSSQAQPQATRGRFADVSYEPAPPFPGTLGGAPTPPEAPRQAGPGPEAPERDDKPAAAPRRKSKAPKLAVYAVGGLLFAGAAAYGTGLMLNQSDIPSGTTVLGTDIGGDSRDQAVSTLDGTVGKAGARPLKLKIGAQTVDLDPTAAGLSFDTTATVDGLTRHSYDPVEVISSLAGGSKAVAPEVKVDRAKLKAALDTLGAGSGQGLQEGFVRFTSDGQTEVVPGKAGQTVDAAAALDQVEQAYRNRAAGQDDTVLTVPVTAAQPKVSADALQAAADSLGKSVLSGNVTVMAGVKKFEFTKAVAASALTLVPDASGKVVLKWDYDKLNDSLKGVFDKTKTRKNGATSAITPQDVADGIASVFDKSAKDRVFRFPAA